MRLIGVLLLAIVTTPFTAWSAEWSTVRCSGMTCHVWRSMPVEVAPYVVDLTFMEVGRGDGICIALNPPETALPLTQIVMALQVDGRTLAPTNGHLGPGFLYTCGFNSEDLVSLRTGQRLTIEIGSASYDLPLAGSDLALKALRHAWQRNRDERIRALEATIAAPQTPGPLLGGLLGG